MKVRILMMISLAIFALSCAKEPNASVKRPTESKPDKPDSSAYKGQKILVKYFTGETCGYCPDGKKQIKVIEELFPEAILPVSLYLYNSKLSSAIAQEFGTMDNVNSFPTISLGYDTYAQIASQYASAPKAVLSESKVSVAPDGKLTVDVSFHVLAPLSSEMSLNVYLLEDSIIATGSLKQSDYLDLLEDLNDTSFWKSDQYSDSTGQLLFKAQTPYMHTNVLAASSEGNDLWGKRLTDGPYKKDDEIKQSFYLTKRNPARPYKLLVLLWQLENKQFNQWKMINGDFID